MKNLFIYLFSILLLGSCKSQQILSNQINYRHPKLNTQGRIEKTGACLNLYWSASSVSTKFYGSELYATLSDLSGENDFEVIIDQDSSYHLDLKKGKTSYLLAKLPLDTHTVTLFKRTEYDRGPTSFYNFRTNENGFFIKQKKPKQNIVFYGNSITAGYSIDDYSGRDSPAGTHTNCYPGYAYQTAQHFDAGYELICKSGIGFMISWFPYIMDDIYDKVNPMDKSSIHRFNKPKDLIIINLGQNDKWLTKRTDYPEHKKLFPLAPPTDSLIIEKYKQFVKKIKSSYPSSKIICTLGSMDATANESSWPKLIKTAVDQLNDPNIYTFNFTHTAKEGHPKLEQHKQMSEELIRFIEENELLQSL